MNGKEEKRKRDLEQLRLMWRKWYSKKRKRYKRMAQECLKHDRGSGGKR